MNNEDLKKLDSLLKELLLNEAASNSFDLQKIVKRSDFLRENGQYFKKTDLIQRYKELTKENLLARNSQFLAKLLMKPTRTASGVAPVTILTKPYPCPGNCIFCPNDLRMPKSYIAEEPGAQRAEMNYFDPYLQVTNRLTALAAMGHSVDKVELIVLGGTWTAYTENYQRWFIKRAFDAMNDFAHKDESQELIKKYQIFQEKLKNLQNKSKDQPFLTNNAEENRQNFAKLQIKGEFSSQNYNQLINKYYKGPEEQVGMTALQKATWEELEKVQRTNETASSRCVGLVLETRPDEITAESVILLRRLGATKIQIGVQSLNDEVLKLNQRGHDVATTARAFALLRLAGFKIHVHYMANLYGSSPEKDEQDFLKLFSDERFMPDELKLYPCSLIASAALMRYYKKGLWKPYTEEELLKISIFMLTQTASYCRVTRMIRDIPSGDIVVGNKKTNFRQIAEDKIKDLNLEVKEIRSREIRSEQFDPLQVKFSLIEYETNVSREQFLQFVVPVVKNGQSEEKLLAFLRLSLPKNARHPVSDLHEELNSAAMIREVHVYGKSLAIGQKDQEQAQHFGFGRQLIAKAATLASAAGYKKLAVISAIGTKNYYRKFDFEDGELYQFLNLK